MDRLGIESAPVVGHSMGGTVAMALAVAKPERVRRVIAVGSPVVGDSLNIFLRLAGRPWIASVVWHLPVALQFGIRVFSPYVVKNWSEWYEMITRDLSQTTLEAFFSSINSLHKTDLSLQLSKVKLPIMGIYGVSDNVVAPSQADLIVQQAVNSRIRMMTASGHFPMLDEPQAFNDQLADFLSYEFVSSN